MSLECSRSDFLGQLRAPVIGTIAACTTATGATLHQGPGASAKCGVYDGTIDDRHGVLIPRVCMPSPRATFVLQRRVTPFVPASGHGTGLGDDGRDVHETSDLPPAGDPGEVPPSSPPMLPQLYTTDATLEALIQLLRHHPRGLLLVRNELTAWVLGMNQYRGGRGTDRQHWLSLWNGAEIIVKRKTCKEVTVVPNPFVRVTGCLPTEVIG
ncbi:MAG: DUF3987 domain-containing protein, partial [Candidatus Entotheonellia bacterium]